MGDLKFAAILLSSLGLAPVSSADSAQPRELGENKVQSPIESWSLVESTSVNFAKGGITLSEAERLNLKAIYERVERKNPIDRILVVAWPDKVDFKSGESIDKAQIILAQKRAEAVEEVIAGITNKAVRSYNMASDSHWLAEILHTKDAELKEAMKSPYAAKENYRDLVEILEKQGGLGKAAVVLQKDGSNTGNKAAGR